MKLAVRTHTCRSDILSSRLRSIIPLRDKLIVYCEQSCANGMKNKIYDSNDGVVKRGIRCWY